MMRATRGMVVAACYGGDRMRVRMAERANDAIQRLQGDGEKRDEEVTTTAHKCLGDCDRLSQWPAGPSIAMKWHSSPRAPHEDNGITQERTGYLRLRRPEDGRFVDSVAVKITRDRLIACLAKLDHAIRGIQLAIAVGVDDPFAIAKDGDLFDSVAVEIADDRQVALLAKFSRL